MATKALATELKDLDVDRVDGVDRPATGRPFALFKSEGDKMDQNAEVMKGYAALATAADMLLKAIRKDATGKVSKSTAVAFNGLAQIMGAEPVFVAKAVPTQPYEITENVDADKRGPADENIGGNFTPRSMPGSMVGKVQFAVKGLEVSVKDTAPMVDDEAKAPAVAAPKLPWDEMKSAVADLTSTIKAQGEQIAALKAAPVAKAEDTKVVKAEDTKDSVTKKDAPASKQVELDEKQVEIRKNAGLRFGTSFENVVFGAAA